MTHQDELSAILKDAGLLDFMDAEAIANFAQRLIDLGIQTPSQTAVLIAERNSARMDRNQHLLVAQDLQVQVREYASAIGWQLTCLNCARLMDQNYEQYTKLDIIQRALDGDLET